MAYKITKYTQQKAKKLGVKIKPSNRKGKKLDVYDKDGDKLASIGAEGMNDYTTYKQKEREGKVPKGFAEKRKKEYKRRHEKDRHKRGSAGFFADQLLW